MQCIKFNSENAEYELINQIQASVFQLFTMLSVGVDRLFSAANNSSSRLTKTIKCGLPISPSVSAVNASNQKRSHNQSSRNQTYDQSSCNQRAFRTRAKQKRKQPATCRQSNTKSVRNGGILETLLFSSQAVTAP